MFPVQFRHRVVSFVAAMTLGAALCGPPVPANAQHAGSHLVPSKKTVGIRHPANMKLMHPKSMQGPPSRAGFSGPGSMGYTRGEFSNVTITPMSREAVDYRTGSENPTSRAITPNHR